MSLPPVIRRIKQKGISEEEIKNLVRDELREEGPFPELTALFIKGLQDSACRFIRIAEDDPYWNTAPQSQNFMAALQHFLEYTLDKEPDDDSLLWGRIGLCVAYSMSSCFGGRYWLPLVMKDTHNIRWVMESALHVWLTSGKDETDSLAEFLHLAETRIPSLRDRLQDFETGNDANLAAMSRVALGVMKGGKLPLLWPNGKLPRSTRAV